jgi:hypothetical protein
MNAMTVLEQRACSAFGFVCYERLGAPVIRRFRVEFVVLHRIWMRGVERRLKALKEGRER